MILGLVQNQSCGKSSNFLPHFLFGIDPESDLHKLIIKYLNTIIMHVSQHMRFEYIGVHWEWCTLESFNKYAWNQSFCFLTFSILEAPPPPSSTSYGATEVPGEPYSAAAACHGAGGGKVGGTAPELGRVGRRGDGVWVSPTQRWGYPWLPSGVLKRGCRMPGKPWKIVGKNGGLKRNIICKWRSWSIAIFTSWLTCLIH